MSGIAGIIRFDGQPIQTADTASVIRLLSHRGKVTSQHVNAGMLMAFDGELEADPSSTVCATLDADVYTSPDQPLTAQFWQKGPTFLNELNADFAVALWDQHHQCLICGRDAMGVKPLYYVHQPGRFFAFASEIKALLHLSDVVIKPNEHKFREFLTWTTSYVPYSAETFYDSIFSVLPGHYVQVSAEAIAVKPYWCPDDQAYTGLTHSEDYAQAFREIFSDAINRRMRGRSRVGSHLSGGLDSSSVSAVAQSLLTQQQRPVLHTFNIQTDLASTDESEYVRAFVEQWQPQQHTVRPVPDVLESIMTINRLFDRPDQFVIPSSFHLSVSQKAQQLGCDLLLTGHDGDSVITTGIDFLDELLDASDWENLQRACRQYIDHRYPPDYTANPPRLRNDAEFETYALGVLSAGLKKRLRQSPGDFLSVFQQQKRTFGFSTLGILRHGVKRIKARVMQREQIDNAFTDAFKERTAPRSALSTEPMATTLSEGKPVPVKQILNTTNVICNEQLNHIGAFYGHTYSFPFFDKQVVELGLATPLHISFDQGRGRGLIRNGLKTVLPPAIAQRLTKANFVEYGNLTARQLYTVAFDQFSSVNHPIWAVIDRGKFAEIVDVVFNPKIPVQQKTRYNWLLSRIIYLALWLNSLPDL